MTPQTTTEWLGALSLAAPQLRRFQWTFRSRSHRPGLIIRNEFDQCVLCCLAEITSVSAAGYSEAWAMALGKAFGKDANLSEARPIALASDRMSTKGPIQSALRSILGVTV